jgi:hypothetical protein
MINLLINGKIWVLDPKKAMITMNRGIEMKNYVEFNGKKWLLDKRKIEKESCIKNISNHLHNFRIYADDHGEDKNIMVGAILMTCGTARGEMEWVMIEFGVPGLFKFFLKKYNEWDIYPVDTKCWVKNKESDPWLPRYFSGKYMDEIPLMFPDGFTSFVMNSTSCPGCKTLQRWQFYTPDDSVVVTE